MKKFFFFFLFVYNINFLFPQTKNELPQVVPPSPTVANLMSFEEVPIDYYTGQPDIGIPIYSKSIGNGLTVNLSLKYHTSGIKIDNRSSWVGTGWSFIAGGSISRTVRGVPDEFQKGPDSSKKTGILHNPDFWNYDNLSQLEKGRFNWRVNGAEQDIYDSQLDLYQFSFLGFSGRFIIVKNGNVLKPVLLTKNQNVKIEINYESASYKINSFLLTDPNGNKFVFDVIEDTESQPFSGFIPQGSAGVGTIPASGVDAIYANRSAWHLSSVKSSNNITLATLNYNTTPLIESYTASVTRTENRITSIAGNINEMLANAYNTSILKPKASVNFLTITAFTKKLTSITFKDNTSIELNSTSGHPETNGQILKDIIIKNINGSENKRYSLIHENTDRLWLTKVEEKAGVNVLNYTLNYNSKHELPSFDSGSNAWGYNSGLGNSNTTCNQQVNFDLNAIKKGLLTSITYPTGGKKQFVFEHNTFSWEGSTPLTTADFFTYNANNVESSSLIDNFSIDNNSGNPLLQNLSVDFDQKVTIKVNLSSSNPDGLYRCKLVLTDGNGFEYRQDLDDSNCNVVSLEAGNYSFGVQLIDPLTLDSFYVTGSASINFKTQKLNYAEEALGGGVRIKEVSFYDLEDPFTPKKKINYFYTDANNPNRSSGSADAKLGSLRRNYSVTTTKYLFGGSINISGGFSARQVVYDVTSNGNTAQLTNGGYIGYKNVIVSETGNGKKEFSYTSPRDYPSPSGTFYYPYPPAPNLDYKRGLLIEQRVYSESGRILSKQSNDTFNFVESVEGPTFNVYDPENCEWKQFYSIYDMYINNSLPLEGAVPLCGPSFPCITVFYNCGQLPIYALKDNVTSGWAQLKSSTSKQYFYDASGNQSVVEKRQEFDYNPENFQQSVVRSFHKENGVDVLYKTELFYPVGGYPTSEFSSSEQQHITKMQSLNMINSPVYTKSYRNTTLLSSVQNIYSEPVSNMIKLSTVKTKKRNDAAEDRVVYHEYDSHGNPLELSKKDGSHVSYIWGHNKTLPIAKIENASYQEIATALGISISTLKGYNQTNLPTINTLRSSLPKAMISTYAYDPIKGIVSSTDTRGYTMTYSYDDFNRLKEVRDANNKLVTDYEYHYKNE
ncbi:RHS repeat domain-containing protein [Spongiivirga citrea]|uniref:RHS repeat protein n=1 Tax=Spongiivirga citrea TaxID=1481457 RepID=A0A6M0CFZ8_9FLAO|nr:RHS repeat domain-containing protein [Spongiivirga citrea]NER16778.1 hypothetical protein [Spongiivirga citrea]